MLSHHHDPTMTVCEVAELLGVSEHDLRSRLARGASGYVGEKSNGRIMLSVRDAYLLGIAYALTAAGWPVKSANAAAATMAGTEPDSDRFVLSRPLGPKRFELQAGNWDDLHPHADAAVTVIAPAIIWDATTRTSSKIMEG
ncbi:hypothetical protein LGR54_24650 [Ancylobacter sp. Lp-2]|uniref:hypothetical protein n=1 Tax=Ancylobacter sp. Lp-2 TaxID=2881339 RepID=UPI001E28A045|nr:hypothetical protein [Ancylobacter sp. Lp-2]MCB4771806.1 hypothetical protein [Ancylobacter sp. Lp-2]